MQLKVCEMQKVCPENRVSQNQDKVLKIGYLKIRTTSPIYVCECPFYVIMSYL